MSNGDKRETFGRAGAYNSEPGRSAGEFGNDGQAGGVAPEGAEYTGQTGTGYGRTPGGETDEDRRLREEVTLRLESDPFLDASHIEASVADGVVTLSGTVSARGDRRRAEDLARAVPGVSRVEAHLAIQDASEG